MHSNPPDQTPNDPTIPKRDDPKIVNAAPVPHAGNRAHVANTSLLLGTFLGPNQRYRIDKHLGRGGFCATYLAYDTQLDRECVIKHLVIDAAWDAETRAAAQLGFQREVQALSSLNDPGHAHIPEIYEFLRESDCLVMKYIKGADLRKVIQQYGVLPLIEALDYTRAVCSALVYMHKHTPTPVLHRDIKPENILLGEDGRIWLIDFGLAKRLPLPGADQAQLSHSAGTLGYTPDEQWRGAAKPHSDIYALAATLYTLITGVIPKPDDSGVIPPVRQHNPVISNEVEHAIAQGMAADPAARPTAQLFLERLDLLRTSLVHAQRLQAPDGTMLKDKQTLVEWCEQHWEQAIHWLYNGMSNHVDLIWGDKPLANRLNRYVDGYPTDHNAALDAALAQIDPRGFGVCMPEITVNTHALDFGALMPQLGQDRTLIVTNIGRRYVYANLARPSWLLTPTPMLRLRPGESGTLRLQAEYRQPMLRGRIKGTIQLRQDETTLEEIRVRASCRSWLRATLERGWLFLLLTAAVILALWGMSAHT
jgi:serine/threonine protein kinase